MICSSKYVSLWCCHCFLFLLSSVSLAKPTLSVSQSTVVELRDMVTFYCHTDVDNVTIHWTSNNSPLALNERMKLSADHKNLTILVVQREDSGSYQCDVQNGFEGQSSDAVLLNVNCESPAPFTRGRHSLPWYRIPGFKCWLRDLCKKVKCRIKVLV